jgi:hypothetical protein
VTSGKWQVVNGNFVDLLAAEAFQEECSEGLRLATSPVFSASRELAGSFRHLPHAVQTWTYRFLWGRNKTTMPANRLGAISILTMYLGMI